MSFITDIVKYGLGQFGIEARGDTPSAILTSALTDVVTEKVSSIVRKTNTTTSSSPSSVASTSRTQTATETIEAQIKVDPKADTNASIPVLYGTGFVEPLVVDAVLTNNNCTMWYAVAFCETTGDLLDGTPSEITFEDIYWDNHKITFYTNGIDPSIVWSAGGSETSAEDRSLIRSAKFYFYNGGSESPAVIQRQGCVVTHGNAYDIMPGWTPNHTMSNLVFAIIRIDYNAQYGIKGLANLRVKLKNTMKKPGDVLNDYMTNTMYGAGIPEGDID